MKIGLTEFILIFCIAAIAIGPNVVLFLRRWTRRAKKGYASAQRRRAVAAIERRAERDEAIARLQKFGYCILAMLLAALIFTLFLRPIAVEPQSYQAPAIRQAAAQRAEQTENISVNGYEEITCVKSRGGWTYFSAKTAEGAYALARVSAVGDTPAAIITTDDEITGFDFAADGSVWLVTVGRGGGALCRVEPDVWGAALTQVVTQINGEALHCPTAVATGADGRVYFTDAVGVAAKHGAAAALRTELIAHTAAGCVYVYDPAALSVQRVVGGIAGASGLALSPDGETLYVSDLGTRCIWAVSPDSRDVLAGGKECAAFAAELPCYPAALAAESDGTLYISYLWACSGWLETNTESTLLRSVALRLPRNLQAKLFKLSANSPAAEAIAPDGTPQAALYIKDSGESGTLTGREPGVFWVYRTK